jgi:hypothetical protein
MVADIPRFSITALRVWPTRRSRGKFCMLRVADLEHVRVLLDDFNLVRLHHFRDDRQAGCVPRLGEVLEALFAKALEAVGGSPGLERAAAEQTCAALGHGRGGLADLIASLDRAGPAITTKSSPPPTRTPLMSITVSACLNSRLHSLYGLVIRVTDSTSGKHLDVLLVVAGEAGPDDPEYDALGAAVNLCVEAIALQTLHNALNVLFRCRGCHDDDHPLRPSWWPIFGPCALVSGAPRLTCG